MGRETDVDSFMEQIDPFFLLILSLIPTYLARDDEPAIFRVIMLRDMREWVDIAVGRIIMGHGRRETKQDQEKTAMQSDGDVAAVL